MGIFKKLFFSLFSSDKNKKSSSAKQGITYELSDKYVEKDILNEDAYLKNVDNNYKTKENICGDNSENYHETNSSPSENILFNFPISFKLSIEWDFPKTSIKESNYDTKRKYKAALLLENAFASDRDKERCHFILNNPNIIAANYCDIDNGFLYVQAIKDYFLLPVEFPEKDEPPKMSLFEIIQKIAEKDIPLSLSVWNWCIEHFMPYAEYEIYGDSHGRGVLTVAVVNQLHLMTNEFKIALVQYIEQNNSFCHKIIKNVPTYDYFNGICDLLYYSIQKTNFKVAKLILNDIIECRPKNLQLLTQVGDTLIFICKTWTEKGTIKSFKTELFPLFKKIDDNIIREKLLEWEKSITDYCQIIEKKYRQKLNKRQHKKIVNSIKQIIRQIEDGEEWIILNNDAPTDIKYTFTYPNGKNGDIDMFIAKNYGEMRQINSLQYSTVLPITAKKHIVLLAYMYYNGECMERNELKQFLYNYNLYHKLRQYCDDFLWTGGDGENTNGTIEDHMKRLGHWFIRNKAMQLTRDYINEIRARRNKIYATIMEQGNASSKWVSQQKAYLTIKKLYPDTMFQYHPKWLGLQSLDIYIPSKKLAVEYQGEQHYKPISYFGGEEGFKRVQQRDAQKKQKCINQGITLIEWRYDEPLSEEFIQNKIIKTLSMNEKTKHKNAQPVIKGGAHEDVENDRKD